MTCIGLCVTLDGNNNVRRNKKQCVVFNCKPTEVFEAFDMNMWC